MVEAHGERIVKTFADELRHLSTLVVQMGGFAEAQLDASVQAVLQRDIELAQTVVKGDDRLDDYDRQIEQETIRVIALRQPVADDLRTVLSALKIAGNIERIGDLAANIAKRGITISQLPVIRPTATIPRFGRLVQEVLKDVMDAFSQHDVDKAIEVWLRDQQLDDMHNSVFRQIMGYMVEDPGSITTCTHLLFMAKNLERIGDHATNIAETVHYQVTGQRLGKLRPKGDASSYAVVRGE